METIINTAEHYAALYGLKVAGSLAILILGIWASKFLTRITVKLMEKSKVDATLRSFLQQAFLYALIVFVVVAALGNLGVQTASLIAVIGAAGLAVALAFQSSLSNISAGALIILFRPFRVGDYITAGGEGGTVESINMFSTLLKTPDNKNVVVPNSQIVGGSITNFSTNDTRRVDMTFGVGYGEDLQKVRKILEEIVSQDSRVLQDPAPAIAVSELADSSVNFVVRPWVNRADYWDVYFDMMETVKTRFDKEGIEIPFPQRVVHHIGDAQRQAA